MLPALESYSPEDWRSAEQKSEAVRTYRSLLARKPDSPASELRLKRHRYWLEAAAATILRRGDAESVCRFWSDAADQLILTAWDLAGLRPLNAAVFALGKLGAQELNLSSDVDLVIVSHPSCHADVSERIPEFQRILSQRTEFGFCLRVDFDLRPGGRWGPLVTTPAQMADYYWSQGETWERLAWVRGRSLHGPPELVGEITELISRYCYRRFLDFHVLDDLRNLRSRIQAHSGGGLDSEFDLKLGVGGIRDIELFVHSLLILHGGRMPEIRTTSTSQAMRNLHRLGVLKKPEFETLFSGYWSLRQKENEVQAVNDRQTHSIVISPTSPKPEECSAIDSIVSAALGAGKPSEDQLPQDFEQQVKWLVALGFDAKTVEEVWPKLMAATALSRHSERDEATRRDVLYLFIKQLHATGFDQNLGLFSLLEFMTAIRARAGFFKLLLREPRLIADLARLLALSPYLGKILSSRPDLLDSFILRADDLQTVDWQEFLEQLAERRLLAEVIAASQLFDRQNVSEVSASLSATADRICLSLLEKLKSESPGSTLEILAMGKWGGRELGVRSDLDLVFVTTNAANEDDFKVAKRFISRLTEYHRGGRIFSVDLRLRPSGSAGPLMVSIDALKEFLTQTSPAWVRQSYLRGRWINNADLPDHKSWYIGRGLSSADEEELRSIRQRLFKAESTGDKWDLKLTFGGLAHIEFAAQTAVLKSSIPLKDTSTVMMIEALAAVNKSWSTDSARLCKNYFFLRLIEQLYQLTSSHEGSTVMTGTEAYRRCAQVLKLSVDQLSRRMADTITENKSILDALDPLSVPR